MIAKVANHPVFGPYPYLEAQSGQGTIPRDSQGAGSLECPRYNGLEDGVPTLSCSLAGAVGVVIPQTGDGTLIEVVCMVGFQVSGNVTIDVRPALIPPEQGGIFLFGSGDAVIDTFGQGVIVIGDEPPKANDDSENILEDTAVSVAVIANDEPNDGSLSLAACFGAVGGTVVQVRDNCEFTPAAN